MASDVFSIIFAIAGTIMVILLTFYASKWYAGKMGSVASGKHIRVIDRLVVSNTGSILIVEVSGEQYMIGMSDKNIQLLQKLEVPILIDSKAGSEKDNFMELVKKKMQKGNWNDKI